MDVLASVNHALVSSVKDVDVTRQFGEYHPSVWGDYFIMHPPSSATDQGQLQRMDELKNDVKHMLKVAKHLSERMKLIDALHRLGIEYHFRDEIHEALQQISNADVDANDLHLVALRFQLLRQQGYNEPADAFNRFKDSGGKFSAEKSYTARDLLSLYDAAVLGTHEEEILSEAMEFSKGRLKSMIPFVEPFLAKQIERALETPFHRGFSRLEARNYISVYQEEREHSNDLLELAKLNFNWLQLYHRAEIREISLWWKDLGLIQKLNFARDRVVEGHYCALGACSEPQYSWGRIQMTKVLTFTSVMDDIFDLYGTMKELELFEDVIQRWDLEDLNSLPDYMKIFFHSFRSTIKEITEGLPLERRHDLHYFAEAFKLLVRAYFEEAKWASKNYMPTLEEYLRVSTMSSGYPMLICISYIVMGDNVTQDSLDWLLKVPKIVEATARMSRLMNDIVSCEREQKRKHVMSSVQCYMKEHHVSEQEACTELQKMIAGAWKDINKECLNGNPSRRTIVMLVLNFARVAEIIYKHGDGYTESSGQTKDQIALLLLHPFEPQK